MNLSTQSLFQIRELLRAKKASSKEVVQDFMGKIEKRNSAINAFVTLNDKAIQQAEAADKKIKEGLEAPLLGLPVGIKDMLCTKGLRTTAASKMLENFVPPYSATVVERLEEAGAVNLGKLNQDEFAMGSSSENSHFGKIRNPWNKDFVPGGSSGGSAAAVAAGMVPATIGTDTGGSIRQPASFCGIVGMKPTYGRVSRYGIVAFASSLDQAGPMTRTVADAALISEVISGWDKFDATTSRRPVPKWSQAMTSNLKGKKVGLLKEFFEYDLHPDVRETTERALKMVKEAGAEVVEVSIPMTEMSVPVYYMVATSEASSNLARYDGVRFGYRSDFDAKPATSIADFYSRSRGEGFGSEVKRRIMLGTYALSSGYYDAFYKKAGQIRRLLKTQFEDAFNKCDFILSPVTASPAFKIGERVEDPLEMYLNDIFTTALNLVGAPGISVPVGFSKQGLPIGVQLMSAAFNEQILFDAGLAIEERANVKELLPNEYK